MKFLNILLLASSAAALSESPQATEVPNLQKRYQKVRLPKSTTAESSTTEVPRPWVRTIYGTVREIVTPTVIEGVTFNNKPSTETEYPQPWVSLDKDGYPKTIIPKIKNGRTENPSPTYATYFQTATTVTYDYNDLRAHNMDEDAIHEEVEYIDEDKTYVSLNPLIRCTPDRYYKKGLARDTDSAPFCTPHEGRELKLGKTYFITWFSKFFSDDVQKVRLHFTYVKEDTMSKGMKKRDVESAFFTTEWLYNYDGYYAFSIQEEWLLEKFIQNVGVSIQPDNVADEEFELLDKAIIFKLLKGAKVAKKNKETRRIEDEGISNDSAYYIMLSIPSVVALAALGMYIFVWITKNDRDVSEIRAKVWKQQHKILGKFKSTGKNKKYSELPQFAPKDGKHV